MVLYNLTVIIEEEIDKSWLSWAKDEFIPEAMSTDLFVSNRLLKVLDSPNEGITYCLQLIADTYSNCQAFQQNFEPAIQAKLSANFENKFVSFSTVMEFINQ
ncbi:DUF4286 family protein [Rubrolithibacter danxiaensis]|uniref:DUF4286 family protein n=1 Tax=Rubrolithibacter danxiaensis TaxID=3390805 RepID=UPI003BF7AC89